MQKQINANLRKMIIMMVLLTGLTYWQIGFIMNAINANVFMNGAIIVAFLGSVVIAFMPVIKLKKELVAFAALQELWEDVKQGTRNSAKDPFWRHYRALKEGQVYGKPKVLGHAYDMVVDEIGRTGNMRIGVNTMSTLVHKIESKINDDKALINYLSGLLVFMGLIGAFIGLLKMVGSIGGIIGGLESAAGGATEAFSTMLKDLQKPLSGMATGFASSLFGLFCSLVIGLLGRFTYQAQNVLKNEFESWLASISHVESPMSGEAGAAGSALDQQLIATLNTTAVQTQQAIERSNAMLQTMAKTQEEQMKAAQKSAEHFASVATQQTELQAHITRIGAIGSSLGDLKSEIGRFEKSVESRVASAVDNMASLIEKTHGSQAASLEKMAQSQADLAVIMSKAQREPVAQANPAAHSTRAIEEGLANGFEKIFRVLEASNRAIAQNLIQSTQQQRAFHAILEKENAATHSFDGAKLASQLESALANGVAQMSQSIGNAVLVSQAMPKAPLEVAGHKPMPHEAQAMLRDKFPHEPEVFSIDASEKQIQPPQDLDLMVNQLYQAARQAHTTQSKAA